MLWLVRAHVASFVVDLLAIVRERDDAGKKPEVLLLRHQIRLLQRHQARPVLATPLVEGWRAQAK